MGPRKFDLVRRKSGWEIRYEPSRIPWVEEMRYHCYPPRGKLPTASFITKRGAEIYCAKSER